MAATGVGMRAITSTLEFLSSYSYLGAQPVSNQEKAFEQLKPLGEAAQAFFRERDHMRGEMDRLQQELEAQKQQTKTYGAQLQELIRRVKHQPQLSTQELLQGIDIPSEGNQSGIISDLLRDIHSLQLQLSSSQTSGRESLSLKAEFELPEIYEYLDCAVQKSKSALNLYRSAELSDNPAPRDAWDRVIGLLSTQEEANIPLVQVVKAKAKALRTLKSIEILSLEQALAHNEVIKSQMMKMLIESETWVLSEIAHRRIACTEELQNVIKVRIELIQAPWTIETARKLTEIHEYYEYLRHIATLQPWIEQVQPEFEWWRLVSSAVKLSDMSLDGLKELTFRLHDQQREQAVEGIQNQVTLLRRQITPNIEGSFNFLTAILEKLIDWEDLKKVYIENLLKSQRPRVSDFEQLKTLTHEFITFVMIFAAFGDEPLIELLTINSKLGREEADVTDSLQRVMAIAVKIKTKVTEKLTEKISPKWVTPLLQTCIGVHSRLDAPDGQTRKAAIEQELKFIEANEEMAQSDLLEHRTKIVRYMSESISFLEGLSQEKTKRLQEANSELQKQKSDALRTQRELDTLKGKFNEYSGRLQQVCDQLATSRDSRVKVISEKCRKAIESSKSTDTELIERFALISETVSSLSVLLLNLEEVTVPVETVEKEVNSVLSVAVSLLEETNKSSLAAAGHHQLDITIKAGDSLQILSEKLRFLGTSLTEIRVALKAKSSGDISFPRKLKHALDLASRNAEDLAKGSLDPDNESRTREKVQETRSKALEAEVGDLAEMLGSMEELVREQVAVRLSEDFKEAEVCEENATPSSPSKKLHATPTSQEKLTKGMDFLMQLVGHMLSALKVDLDPNQLHEKLTQIDQTSGQEKLLLQEAILHWELKEVQAKLTNLHQTLLHKALNNVEELSNQFEDSEIRKELRAEITHIQEEEKQGTVSGVELLDRAEVLMGKSLATYSAEPKGRISAPAGTLSQRIIYKIATLLRAYEKELNVHSITIDVTAQETADLQATGEEKQVLAQISLMEKGLTAISEKATVHKKELKNTKTYIVEQSQAIKEVQFFTLKLFSLEDFSAFQERQNPMDDHIIVILNTANALKTVVSRTFERLKAFSAHVQHPDIISYVEVFIGPPELQESTEELVSEGQGEVRTPPKMSQLRGIPNRPSPYTVIHKAVGSSLEATLEVLDLHHLDQLAAAGREVLGLSLSEGDPVGIIGQKLEFVKDSLQQFKTSYGKGLGERLNPIFQKVMMNLTTAKGIMKNEGNKKQVGDSLKQITDKASANKADILVCLEMAETTLGRVLGELQQDAQQFEVAGESLVQEKPEDVKTKLAAVPSASDKLGKGMGFLLKQTGHLLSTLNLSADSATIDQLQMIEEAAGQDKLILQQALIHSELKRIQTTLKSSLDDLLKKSIAYVRFFGNLEGTESEIEPTLVDIEQNAEHNGADLQVISSVEDILDYLLDSYHPPELQEFTSTEVQESVESPKVEATKLSAVPTTGDKLAKGMSFIMKEMGHMLSVLEVPPREAMTDELQRIDEAVGQDKLILQQALLHSEIKRTLTQIQTIFRDLLHRLITDVRQCSSVRGTSQQIEPTLVEIEDNVSCNGVNLETLFTMEQILGEQVFTALQQPEFESTEVTTSGEAQVQEQTKLAAAPTTADKLDKGMGFLMKQAGHLLKFLNMPQGEQEIEELRKIGEASGQDKLILQQALLHSELKRTVTQMKTIFDDLLHRLIRDVRVCSSSRGTTQETESKLAEIVGKVQGNEVNAEALFILEQLLSDQVSRAQPQVEFEATDVTTSSEAPVQEQTKLAALPTSADKLEKGMGFLMKQAGHLLDFLNMPQGEQEIEQLRQIGEASGQDKLILQQALLHSELKHSITQLRTIFDDLLHRLVRDVRAYSSSRGTTQETEPTLAEIVGKVESRGVNAEALSILEQILSDQVSGAHPQVGFEATDVTTSSEAPVQEQTKLAALPTSADKLEKGMGFLMKQAGHLLDFLNMPQGEQEIEQLRQISEASGQDKLILQQALLHSELKHSITQLRTIFDDLLHRLVRDVRAYSSSRGTTQETEPTLAEIVGKVESRGVNAEALSILEQILSDQVSGALSQVGFEATDVTTSSEAPAQVQTKLAAAPVAADKLGNGMGFLMEQTGHLFEFLDLSQDESEIEQLRQIEEASGQDKLNLQQGLLHNELKRVHEELQRATGYLLTKLFSHAEYLLDFIDPEPRCAAEVRYSTIKSAIEGNQTNIKLLFILTDELVEKQVFIRPDSEGEYEDAEVQESAVENQSVEPTKLSSLPIAEQAEFSADTRIAERVVQGMESLEEDTRKLAYALQIEETSEQRADWETIQVSTEDEKVLRQQDFLHTKLASILEVITSRASVESAQTTHQGVPTDPSEPSAPSASDQDAEFVFQHISSLASMLHATNTQEAQAESERVNTLTGSAKVELQMAINRLNLESLEQKIQEILQSEEAHKTALKDHVLHLKTSLLSMLGQPFLSQWTVVEYASSLEQLEVVRQGFEEVQVSINRTKKAREEELAQNLQVLGKTAELYEALKQVNLEEVQKTVTSSDSSPLSALDCAVHCLSTMSAALEAAKEEIRSIPPPSYTQIHHELELLFPRLKAIFSYTKTEFDVEGRERSASVSTGEAKVVLQLTTLRDGLDVFAERLKVIVKEREKSRNDDRQHFIHILQLLGQEEASEAISKDTRLQFEIVETQLTDVQRHLKTLNPSVEFEKLPLSERLRAVVEELIHLRTSSTALAKKLEVTERQSERSAEQLLESLKQFTDFVPTLKRDEILSEISILSEKTDPANILESGIQLAPRLIVYVSEAYTDASRDAKELKELRIQLGKLVAVDPSVPLSGVGARLVEEVQRLCQLLGLHSDRRELLSTVFPKVQSLCQELKNASDKLDALKKQLSSIVQYIGGDLKEDEQRESSIITRLQELYSEIAKVLAVPESKIKETLVQLVSEHNKVMTWANEVKGTIGEYLSFCTNHPRVDWNDHQAEVIVDEEESFLIRISSWIQSKEVPVCWLKLLYQSHTKVQQELSKYQEAATDVSSASEGGLSQSETTESVHVDKTSTTTVSKSEKGEVSRVTVHTMQVSQGITGKKAVQSEGDRVLSPTTKISEELKSSLGSTSPTSPSKPEEGKSRLAIAPTGTPPKAEEGKSSLAIASTGTTPKAKDGKSSVGNTPTGTTPRAEEGKSSFATASTGTTPKPEERKSSEAIASTGSKPKAEVVKSSPAITKI